MNNPEIFDRVIAVGVDIQNDFCPNGKLGIKEGDQVVPPFNQTTEWVRENNGQVALTQDWHPKKTAHFDKWVPHCIANTEGADFHKDLIVRPTDIILKKGTGVIDDAYSGFEAAADDTTTIEDIITPTKNERIAALFGGLATDWCLKATVLDAAKIANKYITTHRIGIYVIADAVKAVNLTPGDDIAAINEMKLAGAQFINSQDIAKFIKVQG